MSFYLVQFLNGLSYASTLFLIASGLTIVFGVTRITNFAHGSFAMLGAYFAYTYITRLGWEETTAGYFAGMLLAACTVGLIGVAMEVLVLRRVYRAPELFQLLATFAVVLVVQDLALRVWGPQELFAPRVPGLAGTVGIAGEYFPAYHLFIIVLGPAVWALLWLLFHRTRWGVYVRAATQDREMAEALGVPQRRLFSGVLFVGAFLAALGGALLLPVATVNLQMDMNIVVEAFVVVVIGGMGSIAGAAVAALLIGQLHAFGIWLLPQATLVLVFAAMAAVLVLRPAGLFGRAVQAEAPRAAVGDALASAPAYGLRWVAAAAFAAAFALPLVLGDYARVLMTEMLLLALFAMSLQLLVGQGGMVSFGHAAFYGLGAYTAALLAHHLHAPMWAGVLAAPLAAAVGAALFAAVALRSSGIYLAMLTLAFAQILWSLAMQWVDLTGGDNGVLGVWPAGWFASRLGYDYLALATFALCAWAMWRMRRSPFGLALRASRDAPLRAEAIGIGVRATRAAAFAVSGALAGLAGALMAYQKGSVFPDALSISTSIDALAMLLLGGLQSLFGAAAGAAVYHGLHAEVLRLTDAWRLVLGANLLGIVLAFPDGLAGAVGRLRGKGQS